MSIELLEIYGRLGDAGLSELAASLATLAGEDSQIDQLLTVLEAAESLGCGRRTLDKMVTVRRIPTHLRGGRYRFDKLGLLEVTKLAKFLADASQNTERLKKT